MTRQQINVDDDVIGENEYRLRHEITRLRSVLDEIRRMSYKPDPKHPALSTRAEIQLMAEAALTLKEQL